MYATACMQRSEENLQFLSLHYVGPVGWTWSPLCVTDREELGGMPLLKEVCLSYFSAAMSRTHHNQGNL